MKLSIIIPYYKTYKEILQLFKVLKPQLNDNIEVIVIDDGCNCKSLDKLPAKVIHLPINSGTASKPRNVGLDNATGDYIAFIDSDDMITSNYISEIFNKMLKKPDIIYLSWKSNKHNVIIDKKPPRWNCAVWCRVYRKDIIGNLRFNEELRIAEDWEFNSKLHPYYTKAIKQQIYIYNIRTGSLTGRK